MFSGSQVAGFAVCRLHSRGCAAQPTCEAVSCRGREIRAGERSQHSHIFARLMAVIEDRKANPAGRNRTPPRCSPAASTKIGDKIIEEAAEVVEAAGEPGDAGRSSYQLHEAADLIYHLFVMLATATFRWPKSKPSWPAASASPASTKRPLEKARPDSAT